MICQFSGHLRSSIKDIRPKRSFIKNVRPKSDFLDPPLSNIVRLKDTLPAAPAPVHGHPSGLYRA